MEKFRPWGVEEKAFLMLMHLSQLLGYVIPLAGILLPIIMWATNKDESEEVDRHGRIILNWLISSCIYYVISLILLLVYVGVIGLIAVGILTIVFAIIGGVKANKGEFWNYPLSIKFL